MANNLRKSEEVACDFCLQFWKADISALDELIRVLDIIGSRTALGCNDMLLCGLYETTIYQWKTMSAFVKNMLFKLWSLWGQALRAVEYFKEKGVLPKMSITQFPVMVSSAIEDSSIFH